MKQITDILPQKKDKKRVNLYIDGEYFSRIERIILLTENLHIGDYVDEKKLARIIEESEYDACFQKATSYILKGGHTVKQVAGYLKEKCFNGKIIAKVIDKLQDYGYLDDSQFAKTFVELKSSKHGKRLMASELKLKGVSEEVIEEALKSVENEDESAFLVAKKYLKNRPMDITLKQKCFRYVLSKGFSYDSANYAIDKLEREENNF